MYTGVEEWATPSVFGQASIIAPSSMPFLPSRLQQSQEMPRMESSTQPHSSSNNASTPYLSFCSHSSPTKHHSPRQTREKEALIVIWSNEDSCPLCLGWTGWLVVGIEHWSNQRELVPPMVLRDFLCHIHLGDWFVHSITALDERSGSSFGKKKNTRWLISQFH